MIGTSYITSIFVIICNNDLTEKNMKLKKSKSILLIMVLSAILVLEIVYYIQRNNCITTLNHNKTSNAKTDTLTEEKYIRTIRLLLYPYLENEVQRRYGEYAHVNSYDMDIDSISINNNGKIIVVITFRPFIGAHNTISTDIATFQIGHNEAEIIEYITINN
jgi:hypothetical protein